jgi:SAM-dependent methyltransferase
MASNLSATALRHAASALFDHPSSGKKIAALLALLPQEKPLRIFDAGCGDGRLVADYIGRGFSVSGMDAHVEGVAAARAKGVDAVVGDLEAVWPVGSATQDVVLLLDVLEHLVDPAHALGEARRVLSQDGHCIVAFPNHFDLRQRLRMLCGGGIVHWSHQQYADAHAATYRHVRFLRREELEVLFRETGFSVVAWQWNFMGGGILSRRLTPVWLRVFLTRRFPNLFSGKFVALLQKTVEKDAVRPKIVTLPETPEGL